MAEPGLRRSCGLAPGLESHARTGTWTGTWLRHASIISRNARWKLPWHTSDLIQQREDLVKRADVGEEYFSRLCHSFGISRVTGYRRLRRYQLADKARAVLTDRSRGPHSSPNRVPPDVIELVLAHRAQSGWGVRKLSVILGQAGVQIAPSTVNKILKTRKNRFGRSQRTLLDKAGSRRR
jgi:hypothetical protein